MTDKSAAPIKVAILGGGMAALSAAYEITRTPGYEVTIYTLGWRLGGKCASSRGENGRIEEHGIHGFLGSYYNANKMLAEVYRELARPAGSPLATFEEAMVGMDAFQMYLNEGDAATRFNLIFPPNHLFPDPANPGPLVEVENMLKFVIALLERIHGANSEHGLTGHLDTLWQKVGHALKQAEEAAIAWGASHPLVEVIETSIRQIVADIADRLNDNPQIAQILSIIDWTHALIKGALSDEVALKGFDRLDEENWTDWLARHGARPETITAPIALNTVNLAYQYAGGDTAKKPAQMGAGAYVHWSLRALAYCGHAVYAFAAGTGETVIAPFYEVLKKRGVKFEFFSKVEALHLAEDGQNIGSVSIGVQATLKPGVAEYDPLIHPLGLPSWPHDPRFEQLEQGDDPEFRRANLESWWTPWQPVERRTLVAGVDYDKLVFALSVGAVPHVCQDLLAARPEWQRMVQALPTVRTQAFQIWLRESFTDLGWPVPLGGNDTVLADTYKRPFSGHCEMRHILKWEQWPQDDMPKSLWYFCDELPDDQDPAPFSDPSYPDKIAQQVKAHAIDYLNSAIGPMMPLAINQARHGQGPAEALDYSLLSGSVPGQGEAAFDTQFWRANIDPTETYVQSPPGSTKARLKPWDTSFDNLLVAGDWTYTGLNVGSVECAVMSGRLASWGLTGAPRLQDIPGYPSWG